MRKVTALMTAVVGVLLAAPAFGAPPKAPPVKVTRLKEADISAAVKQFKDDCKTTSFDFDQAFRIEAPGSLIDGSGFVAVTCEGKAAVPDEEAREDPAYFLQFKGDKVLHVFKDHGYNAYGWEPMGTALAFADANGDGITDFIAAMQYATGIGPEGGKEQTYVDFWLGAADGTWTSDSKGREAVAGAPNIAKALTALKKFYGKRK